MTCNFPQPDDNGSIPGQRANIECSDCLKLKAEIKRLRNIQAMALDFLDECEIVIDVEELIKILSGE